MTPIKPATAETVELSLLDDGWSLRPVDLRHIERLADVLDECPPILVRRAGRVVLDGHMRVAAARRAGRSALPVFWFAGSDAEACEAAIAANARHGLPLTAPERTAALLALMQLAPHWSNRRLAAAAGVSEATVRRVRRPAASLTQLDGIIGVDGKHYPRDAAVRRAAAIGLIRSRPEMSNRAVAHAVGLSPTTTGALRTATSTKPPFDRHTPVTEQNRSRPHPWATWWARIIGWLMRWTNGHARDFPH